MAIIATDRRSRLQESPLRHVDPLLFGPPFILGVLGLLMVYASTHRILEAEHLDPMFFVKRQIIAIVIGVATLVVLMVID